MIFYVANLRNANQRRQLAGAAAQVAQARADLAILGRAAPRHLLAAGTARIKHPNDSLAQLGARLGINKDMLSSRLRRLHVLAQRKETIS